MAWDLPGFPYISQKSCQEKESCKYLHNTLFLMMILYFLTCSVLHLDCTKITACGDLHHIWRGLDLLMYYPYIKSAQWQEFSGLEINELFCELEAEYHRQCSNQLPRQS